MTCTACERSKADPTNDRQWTAHCLSCKARALASIGIHADQAAHDVLTPEYRKTLGRLFGEQWKLGHERTVDWHRRIQAAAATLKTRKQGTATA